jgi:hypothetical protein
VRNFNRRDFLKFSGTGVAGLAAAVNFPMLGRMALASGTDSNFFTVAVIPDTQNYTDGGYQPASNGIVNLPFFIDQVNYLAANESALKLAFVTHVGDVVQNGDGSTMNFPGKYGTPQNTEWLNAQQAIDLLAAIGVPFGLTPGNHDYDNMDYSTAGKKYPPLVSTSPWWQATWGSGSKYFLGQPWYGGASDSVGYISTGKGGNGTGMWPPAGTPCNYGLSSYQLFSAGGKKFLHISLEMEAGDMAIAWAQGVIDLHPGYATIITTHSYISPPSGGSTRPPALTNPAQGTAVKASYNAASYTTNCPNGSNGAQNIFNKLIAPNAQIFMVLSGHSWGTTSTITGNGNTIKGLSTSQNIRIDNNSAGYPVYQVLSDYQGNTTLGSAGGDGWFRFMQFDMDNNNIHFYTYNAFNGALAGQSLNNVNGESDFNQPAAFSDFSLAMPAQVLNAPSQVSVVSSGFVYNRATRLYTGNLTLTNTSVNPITSSVAVAMNGLTSGVTLVNAIGSRNGAPYTTVTNNGLGAGATLVIPVQFSDPSNAKINFTPVTFQE